MSRSTPRKTSHVLHPSQATDKSAENPSDQSRWSRNAQWSSISQEVSIPGYILDDVALKQTDLSVRQVISGNEGEVRCEAIARVADDSTRHRFPSVDELIVFLNNSNAASKQIEIAYTSTHGTRLDVVFGSDGEVTLEGSSSLPDFRIQIEGVARELAAIDHEIPYLVNVFVISKWPRRVLVQIVALLSALLLLNIGYYFYAISVGVDIDPKYIPEGNKYYQDVDSALKSTDVNDKVDTLLRGHLVSFSNVSSVLSRLRGYLIQCIIGLGISVLMLFAIRYLIRLYPLAFFAIGRQQKVLEKLRRRRDLFVMGIIVAFVVNVVAGVVVTLLLT